MKTFEFIRTAVIIPEDEFNYVFDVDIYRCEQDGKYHLVHEASKGKVRAVAYWDVPADGWVEANDNDSGIAAITSGRSLSSINRAIARLRAEIG